MTNHVALEVAKRSWKPYRAAGQLSIVQRFDCCVFTLQINGLPVPGMLHQDEPVQINVGPLDSQPASMRHKNEP